LLAQHRVLRNGPGDIQINSEERDGERQARINTNRERQLQVELAMLDVIRNNAAIAQQRRLIIEDSIRENANRVSALTEERERIRQENQEKAEERMAEIKGQILAISGVLDDLEDERKIIRRALAPQLNREAMEKAIEDRKQRAGENEAKHERRAERIREAREIRIQQRAQRLARMMAKRTAEIESEKEARIAANAGR